MTSRERILAAFDHKESDRIPVDFNGHRSSGIMVQTYKRLREALGLPEGRRYVYDFIQQLACVESDVLDWAGADVVELGFSSMDKPGFWQPWETPDGVTCEIPAFIDVEKTPEGNIVRGDEGQVICIQKPGHLFFEQTCFPLMDKPADEFERLEHHLAQVMWCRLGIPPAPFAFDDEGMAFLSAWGKELREQEERAIYGTFGGNLIEISEFAFRIDNFLYMLAAEPRKVHLFLDKLTKHHLANIEKYLDALGPNIDIIGFGDDLGMQTGPQISPAMYREFFKDRHRAIWGRAKEIRPDIKLSLHCCGDVYTLLPDMIEAGLEAINPVQFVCPGMELGRLKKEFGKDIVFWGGGCDTQGLLPNGTPGKVKDQVKRNIEILRQDGGFVFQQVHNIIGKVPVENIIAMFEAVKESS
jgi:uroporphyrinogen decarboxylase